jgi:hypothetical protein
MEITRYYTEGTLHHLKLIMAIFALWGLTNPLQGRFMHGKSCYCDANKDIP